MAVPRDSLRSVHARALSQSRRSRGQLALAPAACARSALSESQHQLQLGQTRGITNTKKRRARMYAGAQALALLSGGSSSGARALNSSPCTRLRAHSAQLQGCFTACFMFATR